jgi:integrase
MKRPQNNGPLTKTVIDAFAKQQGSKPEKEYRLWDRGTNGVRGLGLRVKTTGTRSFFYQFRSPADHLKKRITIGSYPAVTIENARKRAQRFAAQILDGMDPIVERQKEDAPQTISQLCDEYLDRARKGLILYRGRAKKASTVAIDEGRVSRHIKPLLGKRTLSEIKSNHIEVFRDKVASGETAKEVRTRARGLARVTGGQGTAGRCVDLLGSIFSYATRQGYMEGVNPVKGVDRLRGESRNRYLSADEFKAFSDALDAIHAEGGNSTALRAFRLLALTGARRNEILALQGEEVNLEKSRFEFFDTKTGPQWRAFGKSAAEVLRAALELSSDPNYVFPGAKAGTHVQNTKLFRAVCRRGNLEGVTPNTLRHSFATVAAELEYAEVTIRALLGHRANSTTGRYAHPVDAAIIGAADAVSEAIAERMASGSKPKRGAVVEFTAAAGAK